MKGKEYQLRTFVQFQIFWIVQKFALNFQQKNNHIKYMLH